MQLVVKYSSTKEIKGNSGTGVRHLPPTSENQSLNPSLTSCGKAGSCLPLVGSLQYRTLMKLYVLVSSALPTICQSITDVVQSVM